MRERDRDVGRFLGDEGRDAPLVHGIQVRVEQAHRERGHAASDQLADRPPRVGLLERRSHRAVGQDALGDLADQPARN